MAVLCPRRVQTAGQRFIRPIAKVKKDEDGTLEKKRRGEREREKEKQAETDRLMWWWGEKKQSGPSARLGPAL
jgi:hypothetical protein